MPPDAPEAEQRVHFVAVAHAQLLPVGQAAVAVVRVLDLVEARILQQSVARVLELRQRQRRGDQAAALRGRPALLRARV